MNKITNVYADNNATTRLDSDVLEAMLPYLTEKFGNASSLHFYGQETRVAVESARAQIAKSIGALDREIFFTSGGTESDNWILKGIFSAHQSKGNHIIVGSTEHHAILDTCKYLAHAKNGAEITYLPVDSKGVVDLEVLKKSIKKETVLVSVMFANNETGAIQPIKEIGEILKNVNAERTNKIYFHSDAVQALGKIKIDVKELNVDALSFSAHKIYGPKGIGALYLRLGTKIDAFMHGGYQEKNRRAGTENVAGIVGFGKAAEKIDESIKIYSDKVKKLRDRLYLGLTSKIVDVEINGSLDDKISLPNTLNLSFKYIEGEGVILLLNCKGIAVSSGSACTSGSLETSHVLKAMGTDIVCAQGSIRFSLGKYNTEQEIDYICEVLPPIIEKLRKMSPLCS